MALALGSRRSTLAGVASALAAMAVAVAVAGRSCRVDDAGPEVAVRDFVAAAKANDRETVFALLSPTTRARLEDQAKDLLSIGSFEGVAPTDITVVEEQGDRAVVYVASIAGKARIELVRVDGLWRIDVPSYGPVTP